MRFERKTPLCQETSYLVNAPCSKRNPPEGAKCLCSAAIIELQLVNELPSAGRALVGRVILILERDAHVHGTNVVTRMAARRAAPRVGRIDAVMALQRCYPVRDRHDVPSRSAAACSSRSPTRSSTPPATPSPTSRRSSTRRPATGPTCATAPAAGGRSPSAGATARPASRCRARRCAPTSTSTPTSTPRSPP